MDFIHELRQYIGPRKIILNCAGALIIKDDKILFQRRTDNGKWGLIGGLLEMNETYEEAALREIWEETGLELLRINDILDNSYSAIGFSNERNVCVFGVARGEFQKSTSDAEEIIPGWYTREEIMKLLRTEAFAARTQAYCYAWALR